MSAFSKTRIAPTPSGYLHLGNVLSFVITAGLARKFNARLLLRIDDLDQERVRTEYVQDIFDTLHFLDIPWGEGPRNVDEYVQKFSQLHRLALYNEALEYLRTHERVFACECSRAKLHETVYTGACISKKISLFKEDCNWRLYTNIEREIQMFDLIQGQQQLNLPAAMQHFVVRKKDGNSAYQLASVIDDIYYGIDLIVRGEDLLDSSFAQLYLSQLLPENRFEEIVFYHHPLLTQTDGSKLSKSAGGTSVHSLRKAGKTSADILTMIASGIGLTTTVERWEELFEGYAGKYGI